jgi:hypothetical protein
MSVLRRIGSFFKGAVRKIGDVGGGILKGVGAVKGVMDKTGITGALTSALASNPYTAPVAAGLTMANPIISGAQSLTSAMSKVS